MRAFVVRPFKEKLGVDFEKVHRELIKPALESAGIDGDTTLEIVEQGDIREDMFRLLVGADIVIADISIHNANVFYELGIRHAVLDRYTLLISCGVDPHVFDLKPDRYLAYNKDDPKASLPDLIRAIDATINSDRVDSPVFRLLPDLQPQDRSQLLPVPRDFREDVDRAKLLKSAGDLRLYAAEVAGLPWEAEGLRLIGRAQIDVKAWRGARETFEKLRKLRSTDAEPYERLGTIYQRLGDLIKADQALQRQVELEGIDGYRRAEALALMARNEKDRWRQDFENAADRQAGALGSPHLQSAIDRYEDGYSQSLNHFYSGLNALALLKVLTELAQVQPGVWAGLHEDESQANSALAERTRQMNDLAVAVKLSLAAGRKRLARSEEANVAPVDEAIWMAISAADLVFLTSDRPERIANAYRSALKDGQAFHHDAARRQIELYRSLNVFANRTEAALRVIEAPAAADAGQAKPPRVLLFTGHMVDAEGRSAPRFPRTPAAEVRAKAMIKQAIEAELALAQGASVGMAGGACGSDILFHEVCSELNISGVLYLALPQAQFQRASVQHGGPDWVERYNNLCDRIKPVVLADSEQLPRWLHAKKNYTIWQRNNLWMLAHALALVQGQGARLTLISLWNGEGGDGPGGTADMVSRALDAGVKHVPLVASELLRA